jgi:hypothetical protein
VQSNTHLFALDDESKRPGLTDQPPKIDINLKKQ